MKRATLQSVNKDRFAFMFATLVGRKVVVKVRSLSAYEGIFSGTTMDKGEYTIVLKYARELPSETRLSGPVLEELILPGKEIIMMNAYDVPESGVESRGSDERGGEFKTDVEINKPRSAARGERNLQSWADYHEGSDVELEAQSKGPVGWNSGAHDQFEVAARMGVVSTYKEDLYTTPLDYSKLSSEQRARAEKIAKEIEGGRNYSSQEEGGDGDEEAMFSAVIGTGGYKKQPQHPSHTESSWRSPPPPAVVTSSDSLMSSSRYASGPNTRLNALNLEPAKIRPVSAAAPPAVVPATNTAKAQAVAPAPRPPTLASASVSEMKSINALNLEPASIGRAASSWAGGSANSAAAKSAPLTKRDFEIALAEIKTRGTVSSSGLGGKGKGKGVTAAPLSPPGGQGSGSSSPSGGAAKGGAGGSSKFSFNPNASTFTPGGMASPPPAAGGPAGASGQNGNTLSIAITPGGSLSGTLKNNQNYDQFGNETNATGPSGSAAPPPQQPPVPTPGQQPTLHPPPPPMMMFPMMPYGMPGMPPMMAAMPPPQMQPPPVFAPLIESSQTERLSMGSLMEKFSEQCGKHSTIGNNSFEWVAVPSVDSNGTPSVSSSYKDILGPLPAPGMPPMMPPPHMMPPPQMMHPGGPGMPPGPMPPPYGGMMLPPGAHPPPHMMMAGPGFPPGPYGPPAFYPAGPPAGGRPPRYAQMPPGQYGYPPYGGPPPRGGGPPGGNPYRSGGNQPPQSQQSSTPGGVTD